MTTEELAKKMLLQAGERLKQRYAAEAVKGALTPEGDQARRIAAFSHQSIDDVLRAIEIELQGY